MYVIIDWHILSDQTLCNILMMRLISLAKWRRYKDSNAVLYEICNEPNGNVTWNDNVKPYAETVIPVIRKYKRYYISRKSDMESEFA